MKRTNFYAIETYDTVKELDHLNNSLLKFKMKYPSSYYVIKEDDLLRPDLISYKAYGTVGFWWLILSINGIMDIFNSDVNTPNKFIVGMTLKIPNILDIYTFRKKYILRT